MILDNNTKFEDLKNLDTINVFHSCSTDNLIKRFEDNPDKNIHAGTLYQAIDRADYKINDEELYHTAYIYEITVSLNGLKEELVIDDGERANSDFEDTFKKDYNILAYKNVGEGNVKYENLSLIILNKCNILSIKLHSVMNGEQIRNELKKYKYSYEP